MVEVLRAVLDLLVLVVSVGLAVYGFSLMRVFRDGLMERPITLLAAAPIIFAAAP